MKVLFVWHRGCNVPYLASCLRHLSSKHLIDLTTMPLQEYLGAHQDSYDVLIYQTFPGEDHSTKFAPYRFLIQKTDERFFKFRGYRILFDAHDGGSADAFSRFDDKTIPRIKNAPHQKFLKEFDLICLTTYPLHAPVREKGVRKNVDISYCVTLRSPDGKIKNTIRPAILEILKSYKRTSSIDIDLEKKRSPAAYREYLRSVWISVNAPGSGEGCFRHLETLNAKSLMFAHESIDYIKLLPNEELIEGEDYISFNLENLAEKLDTLLQHKGLIQEISESGFRKFMSGYSPEKTAMTLFENLSGRLQAAWTPKASPSDVIR